ncbi:MAG: ribonuclease HII [Geobacteraceae bacterium GWC2_55_20]|nr:MAG: ribonuclease HII [Geobacteraceae bacterium GWC2_55_20]OGU26710.1 MAG: ribonuclease HII [Geobacteraceae bacterium GWF2_54_21]HBA72916.1 ribonuclease HII [Geobacter sp.]HCE69295.1 ribonuclease HII [Geobacter sp.]
MTRQDNLFDQLPADTLAYEKFAHTQGFQRIAGVDEVGRGPLAGPVMAAAVILPPGLQIPGIDDSKKLSPLKREILFDVITSKALAIGTGIVEPEVIDSINILQATRLAMLNAVGQLSPLPDFLLIDGITPINTSIPQKTIKKGDSLSLSIAAASIIAKVTRDRLMVEMDKLYPGYGFAGHKGYGSALHLEAIRRLGPCPIHRLTFGGVKEHVQCPSS